MGSTWHLPSNSVLSPGSRLCPLTLHQLLNFAELTGPDIRDMVRNPQGRSLIHRGTGWGKHESMLNTSHPGYVPETSDATASRDPCLWVKKAKAVAFFTRPYLGKTDENIKVLYNCAFKSTDLFLWAIVGLTVSWDPLCLDRPQCLPSLRATGGVITLRPQVKILPSWVTWRHWGGRIEPLKF